VNLRRRDNAITRRKKDSFPQNTDTKDWTT
jgi:hypothetical protein